MFSVNFPLIIHPAVEAERESGEKERIKYRKEKSKHIFWVLFPFNTLLIFGGRARYLFFSLSVNRGKALRTRQILEQQINRNNEKLKKKR